MSKELEVLNNNKNTIDSREVAEMLGKEHSELMKDIKGSGKNKGIIPILEKLKFNVSEYFIESTYKIEGNNKTYKCYLISSKGLQILFCKSQGELGISLVASLLESEKQLNLSISKIIKEKQIIKELYIKRKEIIFIDSLEQSLKPLNIKGKRQYIVQNDKGTTYRIDYYIPQLNIAIEYDENGHANYTYEEQEGRQKEIENKLKCKFIRVTDENSNEYNIGLVLKNIFEVTTL